MQDIMTVATSIRATPRRALPWKAPAAVVAGRASGGKGGPLIRWSGGSSGVAPRDLSTGSLSEPARPSADRRPRPAPEGPRGLAARAPGTLSDAAGLEASDLRAAVLGRGD